MLAPLWTHPTGNQLFISNLRTAQNTKLLEDHGIISVYNVSGRLVQTTCKGGSSNYVHRHLIRGIKDTNNLSPKEIKEYINILSPHAEGVLLDLKEGNVLVHCMEGRNRSALLIAMTILTNTLTNTRSQKDNLVTEVITQMNQKNEEYDRPKILTNDMFIILLRTYIKIENFENKKTDNKSTRTSK